MPMWWFDRKNSGGVLTNESMDLSWFIQHKSDFTSKWEFYQQTWWYGLFLILDTNRQTKSDPLEYGQKQRNQTIQPRFFFYPVGTGGFNHRPKSNCHWLNMIVHPKYWSGWWYTYPSEKYENLLGRLFPIYGKNDWNHQPMMVKPSNTTSFHHFSPRKQRFGSPQLVSWEISASLGGAWHHGAAEPMRLLGLSNIFLLV